MRQLFYEIGGRNGQPAVAVLLGVLLVLLVNYAGNAPDFFNDAGKHEHSSLFLWASLARDHASKL